jgi:hypothetical protein
VSDARSEAAGTVYREFYLNLSSDNISKSIVPLNN